MKILFLTFLLCLLVLFSFGHKQSTFAENLQAAHIRVGVFVDLSGLTSSFGHSTLNGIRLAVEEINRAGGVDKRQVKLIVEDDEGRPAQAATVVTKLIHQDQVHALLGEVASSNSLAAAPKAQLAKVPMITPSSTNPRVTEVGDYIFRACFIDPFQGEALAMFASETLKAKKAAILQDVNSDYSRGMSSEFEKHFTGLGGRVVIRQGYSQVDNDFTAQLHAIRAAKPDVIFVPGYYGQAGVIAKQVRQLKMTQPLLGGDGWDAPQLWDLGGKALNGSFMSSHFAPDDPSPVVQKFIIAYESRYSSQPDAIATLAYDAMNLLASAIERAGTTDGPKLCDALAQTRNFPGVTGAITIDAARNAIKPAVIFELRNGKFIFKQTVQPSQAALTQKF